MEKRALVRSRTQISIACSSLTAGNSAVHSNGIMLNCSCGGSCIEINRRIHKGSILMIKATGWAGNDVPAKPPKGFRTISLAEVKWAKPTDAENVFNYRIGLMYLPN